MIFNAFFLAKWISFCNFALYGQESFIYRCAYQRLRRAVWPDHTAGLSLSLYKGIDFLDEFYDVERTLSFDDVVKDVALLCRNNGGALA